LRLVFPYGIIALFSIIFDYLISGLIAIIKQISKREKMQTKLTGSALGAGLGYMSGIPALIPIGAIVGWQIASFMSEKEIDGEKIVYGTAGENSSYPNYKRTLPNSIRWTKANTVKQRLTRKKDTFYVNNFCFTDKRIKNHFSLLPKLLAKKIENKDLQFSWEALKKGSLIVGSMGQGKTVFMLNIMEQFAQTNRRIVIHDTKGEFTEYFYREEKDYIVNHLEQRGIYWDFFMDNQNGLPVSLILDFFHAYFLAVAGDRGDKFWSTMAALRFEDIFNNVKVDMNIPPEDKMEIFIKAVMTYFKNVKEGQDKTEQSIATTLESSFDIFVKMLYMKKNQYMQGYKPFLFTDFFEKDTDSRIFLHTIEEVSRENIPFIAAFLSLLFKIQLSQTNVKEEQYVLYSLDEYLTFFSLLSSEIKKSLHTKARSTGGLLLPAIQYLPKEEEDRKNLLSSVENMFLFAITDIDTQQSLQAFFGKTKITRVQRAAPKAKLDAQELEIELIDDNIIKMLEVGHHITYMPKEKGTLYVGYTRYPQVLKTQEGYIRQGRDVEDDFILFKQGLLVPKKQQREKRLVPPEVLYIAVEDRYLEIMLTKGLAAKNNIIIQLSTNTSNAQKLKENTEEKLHLLKIDALAMYNDGINFTQVKKDVWATKTLASKYVTKII
jgi:hypothetical protein